MSDISFSKAVEAVWDGEDGEDRRDFLMSLDGAERSLAVLGDLSAEVLNGGFLQWRSNRTGGDAEFVLWALKRIGTEEARRVAVMVGKVAAADLEFLEGRDEDGYQSQFDDEDAAFYAVREALEAQAVRAFTPA